MTNITNIVNLINNFDYAYEMSDSEKVYEKGEINKKIIKDLLYNLKPRELNNIVNSLNNKGIQNYNRYFKT